MDIIITLFTGVTPVKCVKVEVYASVASARVLPSANQSLKNATPETSVSAVITTVTITRQKYAAVSIVHIITTTHNAVIIIKIL